MVSDLKVREFPLVCTAASVRALLAGEKTQHREPVGDHNTVGNFKASMLDLAKAFVDPGPSPIGNPGPYLRATPLPRGPEYFDDVVERLYPSVQVGDRLWVREAWAAFLPCGLRTKYYRTGVMKHEPLGNMGGRVVEVVYRADGEDVTQAHPNNATAKWKRARQMPRWASRLTLEVTDVRVHRLQELSADDARAEGIERHNDDGAWYYGPFGKGTASAVDEFRRVWDTAHYQRGAGWETNPWVIATTFRRVEA